MNDIEFDMNDYSETVPCLPLLCDISLLTFITKMQREIWLTQGKMYKKFLFMVLVEKSYNFCSM